MKKSVGILTAGGDSPGLNAAIRAVGKAGMHRYDMRIVGFRQGFRGLMQNNVIDLDANALSGLLTVGGTILGTSRDKPHKMPVGDQVLDMTDAMVETYHHHNLDALVCLGGGGTIKNAYRLIGKGLNIITLPKTIDNDVYGTDISFGFDTALNIATEAIDRLHSTAHSHHRIIVVELMGHNAGWLALGAGLAGGADVILIPEIPYAVEKVAEAVIARRRSGRQFSIVAIAEGAISTESATMLAEIEDKIKQAKDKKEKKAYKQAKAAFEEAQIASTSELTVQLEQLTGLESRVTILGHVQRGGTPTPADRLLATRLGAASVELVQQEIFGVMVAACGEGTRPVPLKDIVGKRKTVPKDHPWLDLARSLGISLGEA